MDVATHGVRFVRVDSVSLTPRGLLARLHGEHLGIDVVRADIVRLRISRGGHFEDRPSSALAVDPLGEAVTFQVEPGEGAHRVVTDRLVVTLWHDPFRIEVHRADGSPVLQPALDRFGHWGTFSALNDAWLVRRRRTPDDVLHGLGERTGGHDRTGRTLTLWNTDVLDPRSSGEIAAALPGGDPRGDPTSTAFDPYYMSVPLLHHQDGATGAVAGSFVDNPYRGHYDLTDPESVTFGFDGGQYVEYVLAGPTMRRVLEGYTWLTGRMGPPPVWALGFHQCRWHPYTQAEVVELAGRLRDDGIPCDALWLDIDHMDGYRVFTWSPERFPDPEGLIAGLADDGMRVVAIVDPGVKDEPGYPVFDEAVARDVLCRTQGGGRYTGQVWPGRTAFPDFATEEARDWWAERTAAHVRVGLAGVWNDMNEPATGIVPPEGMRFDHGRAPHERFHNEYALLMARATVTGLRSERPDERPFVLSRAGSAGIQRYAANWLGDNFSRWDHLAMSIPMATGMGLSGQPFVGADVGGFMGDCDEELLVRWSQYAALTPFCRNHSAAWTALQYPWTFGPQAEGLVREALRLRYRLMPYLYAAFVQASETGVPVQRPMVLDNEDDPRLRAVDDQYLLGSDLLVAPVLEPGATSRGVLLPRGHWYHWHSDEVVTGAGRLRVEAPPDRIPILVRAGAVVPMWPDAPASAGGHQPESIEVHLFVPARDGHSEGLLVEDDGVSLATLDGAHVRTRFTVQREGSTVRLAGAASGAGYPQFRRGAFVLVVHGAIPRVVHHDGEVREAVDGRVVLPNAGSSLDVRFEV